MRTEADIAHHIVLINFSGSTVHTGNVVVSFLGELLKYLYLGYLHFTVKP